MSTFPQETREFDEGEWGWGHEEFPAKNIQRSNRINQKALRKANMDTTYYN